MTRAVESAAVGFYRIWLRG